ncbi:MerR family transcriptional regulator [Kitasatospora arboriphila]
MEIPTDLTASLAEASITTGGVARRLGVSPTTVRSWERRYGIGPSGHEAGSTAAGDRRTSPCWSRCAASPRTACRPPRPPGSPW